MPGQGCVVNIPAVSLFLASPRKRGSMGFWGRIRGSPLSRGCY
ncbi:hypothetical protein MICA_1170 [Micavibrio aeruginosavorus ARL-13]|uniref:Uncharacterized protein n=1 Tax=Micavibrio aeruginosavorus (strain ARL-13) TaxID=856793 RepID=G2KPJ3_MICAA|nr:hypothetical protein MICA_1170 [Micavibrio aeruginosavorus ARL-13]